MKDLDPYPGSLLTADFETAGTRGRRPADVRETQHTRTIPPRGRWIRTDQTTHIRTGEVREAATMELRRALVAIENADEWLVLLGTHQNTRCSLAIMRQALTRYADRIEEGEHAAAQGLTEDSGPEEDGEEDSHAEESREEEDSDA